MRAKLALALLLAGLMFCWLAPAWAGEIAPADVGPGETPDYIEVIAGELPLILSAPHGGELAPASLPVRTQAVIVNDWQSQALARELAAALEERTGRRPTLVINQLDRSRMDPNRSLAQGAQGAREAQAAWRAYHQAIEAAAARISRACGQGLYLELHSHGQTGRWLELGYGLTADDLAEGDEDLARPRFVVRSNIRSLASQGPADLPELIRGPNSLGGLLETAGFRALPSPGRPQPSGEYFDGGYGVYLHGSRSGGPLDAIQLEAPYDLLTEYWRPRLVAALAEALVTSLQSWYGFDLQPEAGPPCTD